MAAVKTERSSAGHKTAPRRPKDWVAPAEVVRLGGNPGVVASVAPGAAFTARAPQTDEERSAVTAYEAAMKTLGRSVPNDKKTEGALAVAYTRLVQLGLRPALRGRYRP